MAEVRLIDANALDGHKFPAYGATLDARERGWNECIEYLKARAKTIDAVPVVHGRWVHEQRYGDSGGWVWRCTACRREAITPIISALKYCHACGAKMDGGAEDENA